VPAAEHPSTFYLASASPRRASLVSLLGVRSVSIRPSHIDESFDDSLIPFQVAKQLALQKAQASAELITEADEPGIILGADTIVVIEDTILNKPTDPTDAKRMLRMLSNATHTVFTGVALINSTTNEHRNFVEATQVTFRDLSDDEIDRYIAGGSPMDKAGSYGIQDDHGAVFISRIDGDYYNVVGLPLCSTYLQLKEFAPSIFVL
jgi:septum formation protein